MSEKLPSPFLDELDSNTLRIKRSLLVISATTFFCKINNLKISNKPQILGLNVGGLTDTPINIAATILISYLLIHFLANIWSYLSLARLRITEFSSSMPYPNLQQYLMDVTKKLSLKINTINPEEKNALVKKLYTNLSMVNNIQSNLSIGPVRESLERFDKFLSCYTNRTQVIKILLLEIAVPITIATLSITSIWTILPINLIAIGSSIFISIIFFYLFLIQKCSKELLTIIFTIITIISLIILFYPIAN